MEIVLNWLVIRNFTFAVAGEISFSAELEKNSFRGRKNRYYV